MQPGNVRSFDSGVMVTISVFVPTKQGRALRIRVVGAGGKGTITTVTDDPGSERCHPHLFRQLKKLLSEQARWPSDGI